MRLEDDLPMWLEYEIRAREPSITRVLGSRGEPTAYALLRAFDRLISDAKARALDTIDRPFAHPRPTRPRN